MTPEQDGIIKAWDTWLAQTKGGLLDAFHRLVRDAYKRGYRQGQVDMRSKAIDRATWPSIGNDIIAKAMRELEIKDKPE